MFALFICTFVVFTNLVGCQNWDNGQSQIQGNICDRPLQAFVNQLKTDDFLPAVCTISFNNNCADEILGFTGAFADDYQRQTYADEPEFDPSCPQFEPAPNPICDNLITDVLRQVNGSDNQNCVCVFFGALCSVQFPGDCEEDVLDLIIGFRNWKMSQDTIWRSKRGVPMPPIRITSRPLQPFIRPTSNVQPGPNIRQNSKTGLVPIDVQSGSPPISQGSHPGSNGPTGIRPGSTSTNVEPPNQPGRPQPIFRPYDNNVAARQNVQAGSSKWAQISPKLKSIMKTLNRIIKLIKNGVKVAKKIEKMTGKGGGKCQTSGGISFTILGTKQILINLILFTLPAMIIRKINI